MITFRPVLDVFAHENSKVTEFEGHPPDFISVSEKTVVIVLFPFHYFLAEDVATSERIVVSLHSLPFATVNPELAIKIDTRNYD